MTFDAKVVGRWSLAGVMGAAGVVHLTSADSFLPMLPPQLPARVPIVWATGAVELALAAGLVAAPARHRQRAGRALAIYLVAIFPANIYQAVAGTDAFGMTSSTARWLRLLFQPLLIVWALRSTKGGSHVVRRGHHQ